ncbi:MAG TPA: hemerythrin domain-containing protein [Sideroxyarcus sp.]|nr:hemerythrin domain-containing protein [Sideroxyarcus sp.]
MQPGHRHKMRIFQEDADMQTIAEFMTADHHTCDDAFAVAEQAALAGNWGEAEVMFNDFRTDMARHFRMEEDELFPALRSAGGPSGPVQMMLMEHAQMKTLIEQMSGTLERHDAQGYGGLSETLLIVMQQHNLKEEQILYPMADHYLAAQREAVFGRMRMA